MQVLGGHGALRDGMHIKVNRRGSVRRRVKFEVGQAGFLACFAQGGGGDILVTSSISGHIDIVGEPVYSASKHAVQTFAHTLRRQVAGDGIRVMSLAPGPVANPMQSLYEEEAQRRAVEVTGSHLASEDCAEAILFMLSRPPHVTIRDLVILPQMNRV